MRKCVLLILVLDKVRKWKWNKIKNYNDNIQKLPKIKNTFLAITFFWHCFFFYFLSKSYSKLSGLFNYIGLVRGGHLDQTSYILAQSPLCTQCCIVIFKYLYTVLQTIQTELCCWGVCSTTSSSQQKHIISGEGRAFWGLSFVNLTFKKC